jgi:hypothetical protein
MKITVFRDVTTRTLLDVYWSYRETCCLYLVAEDHVLWNLGRQLSEVLIPSIHYGSTASSEPWSPSKSASILLYTQPVSSIHVFLRLVMNPSGQRPPILFLVCLRVLCCGISRKYIIGTIWCSIVIMWPPILVFYF